MGKSSIPQQAASEGKSGGLAAEEAIIISLATLLVPVLLFAFRHLDDNRLTSWFWIFTAPGRRLSDFLLLAVVAVLLANLLSRSDIFAKQPWLLAVCAFTAVVPFWGQPEVIVDASRYFLQAKHFSLFGPGHFLEQWGQEIFAWTDLPLVPLLYGALFKVFGEYRLVVQIANSLFFVGTVMVTVALGKALWDEQTGLYAGLLLLAFPYLLTQVVLTLVDIHVMFFLVLAMYALYQALSHGGTCRILGAGLALLLLFAGKFSAWMFLTVAVVITLVCMVEEAWKKAAGRAALVGGFFLVGAAGLFFLFREVVSAQLAFLLEYQKPGLGRWHESYLSTFFFQIHPFVSLAALGSLVPAILKRDLRYVLVAFLVALVFLTQVQRIRYTLPLFPLVALMAAYGIRALPWRETLQRLVVFGAICTSLVVGTWGFLPFLRSMSAVNIMEAGRLLDTLPAASAQVVSLPEKNPLMNPEIFITLLDLHTRKNLYRSPLQRDTAPPPGYQSSPLRFTWEYPPSRLYRRATPLLAEAALPLVIIAPLANPELPPELARLTRSYSQRKDFFTHPGIFSSLTLVSVYHN